MAEPSAPFYDSAGAAKGAVRLQADLFGIEPNRAVMHQVVVAHLAGRRSGSAKVKSRSEVRGGGRKPWRQKGLGRSRHGSIRSPLWVGGGTAHGPDPRSYEQRTPKKMRLLALRSALSCRAAEGAVKVVEDFDWEAPRTRRAAQLLSAIGADGKALVVLAGGQDTAELSFRNLPQVILGRAGHLNAYDVLWSDTVVFSGSALAFPDPADSLPHLPADPDPAAPAGEVLVDEDVYEEAAATVAEEEETAAAADVGEAEEVAEAAAEVVADSVEAPESGDDGKDADADEGEDVADDDEGEDRAAGSAGRGAAGEGQ